MAESDSQRHIPFRLVSSVAEHHTLVACALFFRIFANYTSVDVLTLFVKSGKNTARIAVKHNLAVVVAYFVDDFAGDTCKVNVSVGFYFAGDNDLTCGDKSFARNFRVSVVCKKFIKDSVGNLVTNFIRVTF